MASHHAPAPAQEAPVEAGHVAYASTRGKWVIAAAVLGSGLAFLDGTVVNVALPAIRRDLGGGLTGLQWVIDAYLLFLGSLIIFGGSLGDLFGRRRIFALGVGGFTIGSLLCGLAPTIGLLIAARALQGAAGALLVPTSLALVSASFQGPDRGQAIGAWSGLSGVSTAIGPFLGGWLVDAASWRWVFLINLPFAVATLLVTYRHVPETRASHAHPDYPGATLAALSLGGLVYGLIEGPNHGFTDPLVLGSLTGGLIGGAAFLVIERRRSEPMLPPTLFRSMQFTGANLTTLVVYGALSGSMFLIVIELQVAMGYSALDAGAALFPITVILLALSPRMGRLASRTGPRVPMTVGPILAGVGLILLVLAAPGSTYHLGILPGVTVFSLGLAITVAPLTTAVLSAAPEQAQGVASGINNAVARIAGLVAIAVLPFLAGLTSGATLTEGFHRGMVITGLMCVVGGVVSWMTIRNEAGAAARAA